MTLATDIKLVFLGESTVGKTSIIACFSQGEFAPDQTSTIGACFSMKKVIVDNEEVKLKIWDTAGQERFRALTPMYYRDAQIAILVYSVDATDTFHKLKKWVEDLKRDTKVMPPLIIAGNKIDLERKVSTEAGEKFAESVGAVFMECSAKAKIGIDELFAAAASMARRDTRVIHEESSKLAQEIMGETKPQKKSSCCK
ncbi:Ras-related protein Rab-5C [Tritrichomonas foetus]|uniref:Ras-related protein Rab-5C n=1 Tax=Tritrichomonas foetus TaxID=1144522 RepID=A0A1J4KL67_9EUKA|nr:Ras-related protein Rab-5C [Tritrichomonas foetus]|eukprot:OHT11688.1 Ras-related protein Rab-5C [Tritrichomonas foetus]